MITAERCQEFCPICKADRTMAVETGLPMVLYWCLTCRNGFSADELRKARKREILAGEKDGS